MSASYLQQLSKFYQMQDFKSDVDSSLRSSLQDRVVQLYAVPMPRAYFLILFHLHR